jgi:radical SAM-linked protein
MARFASDNVAVSLPSLRAGTLTPELMKLIKKVRKTGFTIAPEAGSQRLRDVINKNISEKEIIDTVQDAFNLGWQVIKLYFMIGLPTETDDDLEALVGLVKKLRKIKGSNGRRGKINVSVATFIPKSHTPFQWAGQISLAESRSKIKRLQDQLRLPGIQFKWQNPEVSRLEGLWARGDRRLSRLLITAYKKGCRFDGWSDKFRYRLWQEALEEEGIDPDFFSAGKQDLNEPLPWDHIDSCVSKDFLKTEWEKAFDGSFTNDCRQGVCAQCGACDFREIKVKTYLDIQNEPVEVCGTTKYVGADFKNLSVSYAKLDQAKYLGHLEMVNIFLRALKRAEIPVVFSQGFHPKPKISFDDPLPVGIESQQEHFTLSVPDFVRPEVVSRRLNTHLPDGLVINSCQLASRKPGHQAPKKNTYLVTLKEGHFNKEKLASFNRASDATISFSNRKGKLKKINLKDMVLDIMFLDSACLQMTLLSAPGKTVRPGLILRHIFSVAEDHIKQAKVVKQRA